MKFTFNTGRPYSKDGQIIHVEVEDCEPLTNDIIKAKVWFHDETRMISASAAFYLFTGYTQEEVEHRLMRSYDAGRYTLEANAPKGQARASA